MTTTVKCATKSFSIVTDSLQAWQGTKTGIGKKRFLLLNPPDEEETGKKGKGKDGKGKKGDGKKGKKGKKKKK